MPPTAERSRRDKEDRRRRERRSSLDDVDVAPAAGSSSSSSAAAGAAPDARAPQRNIGRPPRSPRHRSLPINEEMRRTVIIKTPDGTRQLRRAELRHELGRFVKEGDSLRRIGRTYAKELSRLLREKRVYVHDADGDGQEQLMLPPSPSVALVGGRILNARRPNKDAETMEFQLFGPTWTTRGEEGDDEDPAEQLVFFLRVNEHGLKPHGLQWNGTAFSEQDEAQSDLRKQLVAVTLAIRDAVLDVMGPEVHEDEAVEAELQVVANHAAHQAAIDVLGPNGEEALSELQRRVAASDVSRNILNQVLLDVLGLEYVDDKPDEEEDEPVDDDGRNQRRRKRTRNSDSTRGGDRRGGGGGGAFSAQGHGSDEEEDSDDEVDKEEMGPRRGACRAPPNRARSGRCREDRTEQDRPTKRVRWAPVLATTNAPTRDDHGRFGSILAPRGGGSNNNSEDDRRSDDKENRPHPRDGSVQNAAPRRSRTPEGPTSWTSATGTASANRSEPGSSGPSVGDRTDGDEGDQGGLHHVASTTRGSTHRPAVNVGNEGTNRAKAATTYGELQKELEATQRENAALRAALEATQAAHQQKLEEMSAAHEAEINTIQGRHRRSKDREDALIAQHETDTDDLDNEIMVLTTENEDDDDDTNAEPGDHP